ncbi:hypothetical protein G5714_011910 [Onychostoma macrolepis]|uniref:Uncharacterized protein n=1 Tax=Onychostoma macrolepis TaxID=369639 RepID=A0A7J6CK65_9TELE|nr:hypothetical protein G5714_011910 [Onychostoma macrolepis]
MSKASVFFTECSEVKSEGLDRLEMISLTSDIMSDSVSLEEVTTDKKPVKTTTGGSGNVSSDNQGGMKACVENRPTGHKTISLAKITTGITDSGQMLSQGQSVLNLIKKHKCQDSGYEMLFPPSVASGRMGT